MRAGQTGCSVYQGHSPLNPWGQRKCFWSPMPSPGFLENRPRMHWGSELGR